MHCLLGRTLTLGYLVKQYAEGLCKLPLALADKAVASPSPSLSTFSNLSWLGKE